MAHVRKRGSKYRAEVRLADGRRISYTSSLRENAKRWARDRERERDMGLEYVDVRLGRRTLLSNWYVEWLPTLTVARSTLNTYQSAWRVHIEPYLGDRGVSSISRMDVQRWQADLERKHGSGKARMRGVALQVLSNMLQMACQSSPPLRLDNPCLGVKPPRHEPEPGYALSVQEAEKLLAELAPNDLLVDLMLSCGLRWSEAAAVMGDAIDRRHGFLHVRRKLTQSGELLEVGKSSAANRHVPLTPRVLERLFDAPEGLLFTTPSGQRRVHEDGRLTYRNWLRLVWRPAADGIGLPQLTPHDCRHSYITWLMAAGADEIKVQRVVGHTTGRMTRRYTHLRPDHYTELIQLLEPPVLEARDATVTPEHDEGPHSASE